MNLTTPRAIRITEKFLGGASIKEIATAERLKPETVRTMLWARQRANPSLNLGKIKTRSEIPNEQREAIFDRLQMLMDTCWRTAVFARVLETDGAVVYNWQKRKFLPSVTCLYRICERFDISADWLLFGKGEVPDLTGMRHVA